MKKMEGHTWYLKSHYNCYAELAKDLRITRLSAISDIESRIVKAANEAVDAKALAKNIKENYDDLVLGCQSECSCSCECVCNCDEPVDLRRELKFDEKPVRNNAIYFSEISKLEEREQKRLWNELIL